MKKFITASVLTLLAVFFIALPVYADEISVTIDGQQVVFEGQHPVNISGRVLVPVRGVFEMMGFDVEWEPTTKTAILTNESYEVRIQIGQAVFYTNGVAYQLDVPAQIIGGSTMVPLRLPLESVGYYLDWVGSTRTVLISSVPFPTAPTPAPARSIPTQATRIASAANIADRGQSFFILPDGSLWAWGNNNGGQLGDGTEISRPSPVHIMDDVVQISSRYGMTLALRSDGSLWGWGATGDVAGSVIGDGNRTRHSSPVHILDNVVYASVGVRSMAAVKNDGSVWAWGQLAMGSHYNQSPHRYPHLYPIRVEGISDAVSVSACSGRVFIIRNDRSLWAFGHNRGGLGDGAVADRYHPVHIMDNVAYVSASGSSISALQTDGSLWAWGWNHDGWLLLGRGNTTCSASASSNRRPVRIMDDVVAFCNAGAHRMVIRTDGSLWGWGYNWTGQLGDGTITELTPNPVHIMDNVVEVSTGNGNTMAICTEGHLWVWGSNSAGQIGDGKVNLPASLVWEGDEGTFITHSDYNRNRPALIWSNTEGWSYGHGNQMVEHPSVPAAEGQFAIRNQAGRYLAIVDGVLTCSPIRGNNMWYLQETGLGSYFIYDNNPASGMRLDLWNNWDAEDIVVQMFASSGHINAQMWFFEPNGDGTYQIRTSNSSQRVITSNDGKQITIQTFMWLDTQMWILEPYA